MPTTRLADSLKDAVPLVKAAALIPGKRPHVATLWRWATRGVRGVKLQTWVSGGKRVTTAVAIEQFLQSLNADADPPQDDDSARRAKEAGRALEKLGA